MKKYLIFLGLAGVSLLQYCKKNGGHSLVEIPDIPPVRQTWYNPGLMHTYNVPKPLMTVRQNHFVLKHFSG